MLSNIHEGYVMPFDCELAENLYCKFVQIVNCDV